MVRIGSCAAALCLLTLGWPLPAPAQDRIVSEGRRLYVRYCASCHGVDARGSGPAASALKTPPPDLTRIRARNGDRWPYLQLIDIIDGRSPLASHGPREMPVWGEKLGGQDPGSELRVSNTITSLLAYLKTLQVPAAPDSP